MFSTLLYSAVLTSCTEKKNTDKSLFLYGRWTVESATRGEKQTDLLNDTWFEFSSEGALETNLPSLEGKTVFSIEKDIIRKEGRIPVDFTIKEMTDSILILGFEMRSQQFILNLIRNDSTFENKSEAEAVEEMAMPTEPTK